MQVCRNGRRGGLKNRWANTRVGSTPTPGTSKLQWQTAHIAQSVEHILGKNEVNSSILFVGFLFL